MSDVSNTWPHERGRRGAIEVQFGATRADILQRALTTGDLLADAVAAAIHADGRAVRVQLDTGIRSGLAAVADPHPAVAALLTSTESLPRYATEELLESGSLPFFTVPAAVHVVSLSAGALIRVYQSPSIAEVLTTTGRLIDGAQRRLEETGTWLSRVMLPGGMRVGAPGYVATLQVRMLHAHMRQLARTRGFDEAAYGVPINQVDLARVWMTFTVTTFEAENVMGYGLTSAETAQLYRCWWVLAHLLGIDPTLVEGISANEQAHRVDELLQSVMGPLIPESQALTESTLSSVAGVLNELLRVPTPLGSVALHTLARRFHPSAVSDELGLRRNAAAEAVLDAAFAGIRARRAAQRRNPARWAQAQRANIDFTEADLRSSTPAAYEHRAGH